MAFQVKDWLSIVASMVNHMRGATPRFTDYNVGSVGRTLVEAPAVELDQLYQQMQTGLIEAIPVSVYNSFNFPALAAVAASGRIRVNITPGTTAVTIPAGSVFVRSDASGRGYVSQEPGVIAPSASYVDLTVVAQAPGSGGNMPAGTAFDMANPAERLVSVAALSRFDNGTDEEGTDARRLRFNAFIASLPRGTLAALEYGLKTVALTDANGLVTERVVSCAIIEPYLADPNQPIALVRCYIHNGAGATSGALVQRAAKVLYGYYDSEGKPVPGWQAAGVQVEVYAATEQAANVAGTVAVANGYSAATVLAAATAEVSAYLSALGIGAPFLRAEAISRVMALEGVTNVILTTPAADVAAAATVKLKPGAVTLTAAA